MHGYFLMLGNHAVKVKVHARVMCFIGGDIPSSIGCFHRSTGQTVIPVHIVV
jgi:hypothetical protein